MKSSMEYISVCLLLYKDCLSYKTKHTLHDHSVMPEL